MQNKVLEIIIDGFGFDQDLEIDILKSSFQALPSKLKEAFVKHIYKQVIGNRKNISPEYVFILLFNRNYLNLCSAKRQEPPSVVTESNSRWIKGRFHSHREKIEELVTEIGEIIRNISRVKNYAVWAASTPCIDGLREKYPSIATKTTGIEIGYEDLQPEVQGNSETGHQQLGNLTVAPQIPLKVAIDIETGKFFENTVIHKAIAEAIGRDANLNITFMVSGKFGNDGRVHSCWNHLESFLDILFTKCNFDPNRLRIQAILDGRDAPLRSSVEEQDGNGGFLHKLKKLLMKYRAEDSAAWIIGRGIGMDRDYEEERTKKDYELLIDGKGLVVDSLDDAIETIRSFHRENVFDPFIEPIVIKDMKGVIRKIEVNDVVVNLNFRADRQRARMASLLGAKEFLQTQASKKGRRWRLDWIREDLNLSLFCLTEYHPDLEKYGTEIIYPIEPQEHNFLSVFSEYFESTHRPFKYLLIAESTKAVHMGYFIRGRREKIEVGDFETRFIIPSYAEEHGILTDDDYFKTPQMKAFEIGGKLLNELALGIYDLAIVNLSNPDMLGHLINDHFDACVKGLETVDYIVDSIVPYALAQDYHVIITSDHGNIDEYSSSHSLNKVITTFISPESKLFLNKKPDEFIRLFDIPWAIAEILGIKDKINSMIPPIPDWIRKRGMVGESPISISSPSLSEYQHSERSVT